MPPDHDPWLVVGVLIGTFVLWALVVWIIGRFIHIGMAEEEDERPD